MAAQLGGGDDMVSAINVTPFVDVVLVLLVILMVTSTEMVKASMKVDLPQAAAAGAQVDSTLNVVVEKDGAFYLDGSQVSAEQLVKATKDAKLSEPKVRAVISADQEVAYRSVMKAIDLVKQGGVSQFALDVERAAPEG